MMRVIRHAPALAWCVLVLIASERYLHAADIGERVAARVVMMMEKDE